MSNAGAVMLVRFCSHFSLKPDTTRQENALLRDLILFRASAEDGISLFTLVPVRILIAEICKNYSKLWRAELGRSPQFG